MPRAEVTFHPLAAKEYLAARRWYGRRSHAAALRFRQAVDQTTERIADLPELGVPFRERFRWRKTRRFPYVIYYRALPDGRIVIVAVAHARRRLGYWLRRMPG